MLRLALVANVRTPPYGNNLNPLVRALASLAEARLFVPTDDLSFTPTGGAAPAPVPPSLLAPMAAFAPHAVICLGGGLVIPPEGRAQLPGQPVLVGIALSDPQALPTSLEVAPAFDLFFTQDGGSLPRYREHGVEALYLPLAADPEVFAPPVAARKSWDVLYVGKWTPYRDALMSALGEIAAVRVLAYRGEGRWRVPVGPQVDDERTLAEEMNRARLVLDPTRVELQPDPARDAYRITPRALMAAACGVPPLVEDRCPLDGLLTPGEEVATFDGTPAGLARVIQGLLADPERRRQMGLAARRRVERDHSWAHRARQILDAVAEIRPAFPPAGR
ncbi:MAG: glycosyltransferase [Acidobacteriota bacterium]|jgi:hypothetical protein